MKSLALLLATAFTLVLTSQSGFASSTVCIQGPTSTITGTGNWQVVYSCTIPANSIASGRAIRITAQGQVGSSTTLVNVALFINGVETAGNAVPGNDYPYFGVLIFNTGSTTGELCGLTPSTTALQVTSACSSISGLDWSANQAVEIEFATVGKTFRGLTFLVEEE